MSLFLCQSFITNINITPAREIPPATSGKAECPILSSFYQYGAAAWETLVRCVGPCRRTQAQVGSFRPIQVSWEGAAGHLGPDLLHPPALRTSCEGTGRMSSTGGGCDLQNFLLCCLDLFFFFFLKPGSDYAAKHPCQAGRAGWPLGVPRCRRRRAVAAGPAAAGLPATWGAPLRGCRLQFALGLQPQRWFGLRMSSPGLAGLGGNFVPVLVDCGLAGPTQCKAAGLLQPCSLLPRASRWTWTTNKVLSPRTGQKRNRDPNAAQPKEGEINHKSHISLASPTHSRLRRRGFFYGLSFTWFCTSASMTKAFNTRKVITAMKFPLCDLPR